MTRQFHQLDQIDPAEGSALVARLVTILSRWFDTMRLKYQWLGRSHKYSLVQYGAACNSAGRLTDLRVHGPYMDNSL